MSKLLSGLLPALLFCLLCSKPAAIVIQPEPDRNRIHVLTNGDTLTTCHIGQSLSKPFLFPVKTLSNLVLTRNFPLIDNDSESRDHPHHTGLWFACAEVNGHDFWTSRDSLPRIEHAAILSSKADHQNGSLKTINHWIGKNEKILLIEHRTMHFELEKNKRYYTVDFTFKLTAEDTVIIHDTKEGMLAIRVADWLREKGGNGMYRNAAGDSLEAGIWGKRSPYVWLQGSRDNQTAGIVIMNHPESLNYPTFWMTRGYGLFSANPVGQLVYETWHQQPNAAPFNLTLAPEESAVFRFKMVFYHYPLSYEEIDFIFKRYCNDTSY